MNESVLPTDEERQMLRDSLRGFLERRWPPAEVGTRTATPEELARLWSDIAVQGLASLGTDPSEAGLRGIAVVMQELGRAACPAPVLEAVLANFVLTESHEDPSVNAFLNRLHAGEASVSVAFGEFDGDANAGSARIEGRTVSGKLRFVEGAETATYLLVLVAEGPSAALISKDGVGVHVTATRSLGAGGLAEVELKAAPATIVAILPELVRDLNLISRLCLVARAYGAALRSFEMAVDYAKERHQFGQPIGKFQAIQHKLADCLIALEGVRLTLQNAAAMYDFNASNWRYFSSAAVSFASAALRKVSLETHHTFGAIGYAEEHEAPHHFRRVHSDVMRHGGGSRARGELANYLLSDGGRLPEYDLGDAGNAFRNQVRAWLETHWSGERKAQWDKRPYADRDFDPEFAREVGETRWIGMSWPREFAGQQRSPLERLAFMEEMERVGAPRIGAEIQAVALMRFGTEAQKAKYLPEILSGQAMYGMGYSEPNSGSDLASLRTTATRDGDEWVINGQKIWTTTWWGKFMFLAARTHPDRKLKHRGISMFIVPMDACGITIKPARTMYDGTFANIFYDNVRLPADALIGTENDGWNVLTSALATERGLVGGGIITKVAHAFTLLCDCVKAATADGQPLRENPLVRDCIASLAADIEVGRQLMVHCAANEDGVTPPADAAISKVYSGELMERLGECSFDILGVIATLSEGAPGAIAKGKLEHTLRHSLMWVISIGTNEIQRSLIAQQGLGLPR